MKLSTKFDFGLNELVVVRKSHLCKLHAKSELAALVDFILILHVRMHITKKQLLVF